MNHDDQQDGIAQGRHRPSQDSGEIAVTTVEVSERRHLVEPYRSMPVLEFRPGVSACRFCGNTRFRRSRLRLPDLGEVLMLRYPCRCTRCGQRQYTLLHVALLSFGQKSLVPRPATPGHDTWKDWTDPALVQGQVVARPLSTAIGPRAQRLEANSRPTRPAPPPRIPSRRDDNGIW